MKIKVEQRESEPYKQQINKKKDYMVTVLARPLELQTDLVMEEEVMMSKWEIIQEKT